MNLVTAWLRMDLRRRRRSLAVLAILIAITGGTVMTAAAGARRGSSAWPRLVARTLPATAAILANTPGFGWSRVAALPEVESLTRFVVDYFLQVEGVSSDSIGFPFIDGNVMRTMEKPVVFAGRLFDPTRSDEVVVSRKFIAIYHKHIGDTLTIDLPTPGQLNSTNPDSGNLTGPRVGVRIVGVISSPWWSDQVDRPGLLQVSPGFATRYRANIVGDQSNPETFTYINAMVRLRGGATALPQFRKDLTALTGRSDIDVLDLVAGGAILQRQLSFEARCLLAFGAAALLAALFLVGQAIARYAAASTAELQTLRALGMTPRQSVMTAAAGPALAGAIGALLAVLGTWFSSRWFPIGSASLVEPSPGRQLDWVVVAPGVVTTILLVIVAASAAARLTLSAARRPAVSRSTLADGAARIGMPVPVVVGIRFALESGRGRSRVSATPALIGAVTGVLGILAAFTFSHAVSDAAGNPARFGQTFQFIAEDGLNGHDFGPITTLDHDLLQQADVTGVDDARIAVATGPRGTGSVTLYTYSAGAKPIPAVVTAGRMPQTSDEVLLGPQTLTTLHTHIGGKVALTGSRGAIAYTVSGTGLVPQGSHNGYADGGWVTPAGYDAIFTGFKFRETFISVAGGSTTPDAAAALTAAMTRADPALSDIEIDPADVPTELTEIREVRVLPVVLGGFLALLALGAVGHALATAVRRRAPELAVLRAFGMTPWQCRWVVVTQASVLAVIGLVFGVPLGLALGRSVWRVVADYTPLQYLPPFAVWAMALVGPAALLAANLLAAWPGRRAARLNIAAILRAE